MDDGSPGFYGRELSGKGRSARGEENKGSLSGASEERVPLLRPKRRGCDRWLRGSGSRLGGGSPIASDTDGRPGRIARHALVRRGALMRKRCRDAEPEPAHQHPHCAYAFIEWGRHRFPGAIQSIMFYHTRLRTILACYLVSV